MVEGKKRHTQEQGKDLSRLYSSIETSGFFTDNLLVYLLIEAKTHSQKLNLLFKSHKMCKPECLRKC